MVTFKSLFEKIKNVSWEKFPKIGWWLDKDIIRFYHGTHKKNLKFIEKNGLVAPTEGSSAGWVSLALEPITANAYAVMSGAGGETNFRDAGKQVIQTPTEDRIVFIIDLPKSKVLNEMAPERGAMQSTKGKLTDKARYLKSNKKDFQYYALTEIRMPNVDKKYIKGYMVKK